MIKHDIMDTNMFSKGGASDPRVDLRVGDREAKSSTQKKTIKNARAKTKKTKTEEEEEEEEA